MFCNGASRPRPYASPAPQSERDEPTISTTSLSLYLRDPSPPDLHDPKNLCPSLPNLTFASSAKINRWSSGDRRAQTTATRMRQRGATSGRWRDLHANGGNSLATSPSTGQAHWSHPPCKHYEVLSMACCCFLFFFVSSEITTCSMDLCLHGLSLLYG
jgi:hypothetical protein